MGESTLASKTRAEGSQTRWLPSSPGLGHTVV